MSRERGRGGAGAAAAGRVRWAGPLLLAHGWCFPSALERAGVGRAEPGRAVQTWASCTLGLRGKGAGLRAGLAWPGAAAGCRRGERASWGPRR